MLELSFKKIILRAWLNFAAYCMVIICYTVTQYPSDCHPLHFTNTQYV